LNVDGTFKGPRPTRILCAAVLGASLGYIGASIVNVALPTFQQALGADATEIQWIVSAYNLAVAALLLSSGAFSDRFGHAATFKLGVFAVVVGSSVCALAENPGMLIAGRVVQGLAAALLVPASLGLVNTAYPPAARGHAVSLWSSFSAVGAGMGPFIGGFLIDYASWRYVFWMNLPVGLVAWRLLAGGDPPPRITHDQAFDWRGAVFSVLALGLFTYAAIESSKLGPGNPLVLSLFAGAIGFGSVFLYTQGRGAAPLMPLVLFRSRNFTAANVVTFLAYSTIGGGFYVMMLTWIQIQGYSALAAGAITLPFMVLTGTLAHPVGRLVRRIGPKLPLSGGALLLGLGFLSWTLPGIGTPFLIGYLPGIIVTAIGLALLVGPVTTVVMGAVELRQSGIASGVNSAVARSAILLSVAVMGAIHIAAFERTADAAIGALQLGAATVAYMHDQLINMAAADIPTDLPDATREALAGIIRESFLSAARKVMVISGLLALAGAAIAFRYVDRPQLREP